MSPLSQERIYYRDGPITITSKRIQSGSTSYPLGHAEAVAAAPSLAYLLIGVPMLLVGIVAFLTVDDDAARLFLSSLLPLGIGMFCLGEYLRIGWTYLVTIDAPSGTVPILGSGSRAYVNKVVEQINRALAER